jgi:hypothetical protein
MAFAPGQFITAQRLNRLQPKTYWAQASGTTPVSSSGVDVAGTSFSVVVETDGATVAIDWSISAYATAVTGGTVSARPQFGADSSPVFAVAQFSAATEKVSAANFWSFTVATAGTYTAKIVATTPAQATLSNYTSIKVVVTEVA